MYIYICQFQTKIQFLLIKYLYKVTFTSPSISLGHCLPPSKCISFMYRERVCFPLPHLLPVWHSDHSDQSLMMQSCGHGTKHISSTSLKTYMNQSSHQNSYFSAGILT